VPSAFTHGFFAYTLGRVGFTKEASLKALLIAIVISALPDADVIAFKFGIPYEHPLGHRGFTHSIFFAFVFSFLLLRIFYRSLKVGSRSWFALFILFFLSMASHGVLDAMTDGGRGIAFFWPFSDERYFFPWRPMKSAPLSAARFFTERGWRVFQSEFAVVWVPCLVLLFSKIVVEKSR